MRQNLLELIITFCINIEIYSEGSCSPDYQMWMLRGKEIAGESTMMILVSFWEIEAVCLLLPLLQEKLMLAERININGKQRDAG